MAQNIHPDRVEDSQKAESTEKFKVLQKVHAVLMDKNKRSVYDETGIVENDEVPRVYIVSDAQMTLSKQNYVGEKTIYNLRISLVLSIEFIFKVLS